MKILITGGTGFLGTKLTTRLLSQGHTVSIFSRSLAKVKNRFANKITALTAWSDVANQGNFDVIINLAGAPIFASRWTESRKQTIRESRIGLTKQLIDCIEGCQQKPSVLISGSAVGIYGDQGDAQLTEQSNLASCFSQRLCSDWEYSANQAEQFGVRVCFIRTGLVLGQGGGLLKQMLLPFKLGLGGTLGSGRQWMSWIHVDDWVAIVDKMINDTSMKGAYNATVPNPVTNRQFTETLSAVLQRPALMPLPAIVLKLLFGEMSELLLASQRVLPDRLSRAGFQFKYTELRPALHDLLVG